jgi:RNA polymerase sigma-70 factor (ECF subfamily)
MARVRDPARGAAYLRSIVINLARDHNRRGLVSLHHRPPPADDEPSAEEAVLGRSARQEVIDALRALPGRQRECLTLRYYYDMSPADIADGLGMSVNSVKTHLQRGLRALSLALREDP